MRRLNQADIVKNNILHKIHNKIPDSINEQFDIIVTQFEAVHEDLTSAFQKSFKDLGLSSKGLLNKRIVESRGSFFDIIKHRNNGVKFVPIENAQDWDDMASYSYAANPQAIYANTLQRDSVASWVGQFNLPIMGVVHNPYMFRDSVKCRELASTGRLTLFGLAPHVLSTLEAEIPEMKGKCFLHNAYEWEAANSVSTSYDDKRILDIVIPGAVEFGNRDFQGLIDFLADGGLKNQRPVKFSILAGGSGRERLEKQIIKKNIEKYFDIAEKNPISKRVMQDVYLTRLAAADALLLLLPANRKDYLESKITTGVMAGIGARKPMITTQVVSDVYNIPAIIVPCNKPFDISTVDLSAKNLASKAWQTSIKKERGLQENTETLRHVLFNIMNLKQKI